jgi:hypothetical protein
VRLITEPDEYRNPARLWHAANIDRMHAGGVRIKHRKHNGVMHQGSIVLHGLGEVIFGSSNWTMASAIHQDEHNYFYNPSLGKPRFFQWFVDQFERKWNDPAAFAPFAPLPPHAPSYASPVNGASGLSSTATLTWDGGPWAHLYDIYCGTTPTPPLLKGNVEVGSPEPGRLETFSVSNLLPGTTYYWRIVGKTWAQLGTTGATWSFTTGGTAPAVPTLLAPSALPSPWTSSDIGSVGAAGRASFAASTLEVLGGGSAVFDVADAFHFVHRQLTGDGDVIARVDTLGKPADASSALAGLMFRASLSSGSPHASLIITTDGKAKFRRRTVSGGTTYSDGPTGATTYAPHWLKVSRRGATFTALLSSDGLQWTQVHTAQTVTLPGTVEVGVLTLRSGGSGLARATFSSVNVTAAVPSSVTPAAGLPDGWASVDVGAAQQGQAGHSAGRYTLQAGGTELWGARDGFLFAYRTLSGDGEIVARLERLTVPAGGGSTLGGVMIRESLADNARHASMIVTTDGKAKFRRRLDVGGATLSDGPASGTTSAPRWLKLQRSGDRFTAWLSSDGSAWQLVHATQSISMGSTVYIGMIGLGSGGTSRGEAAFTNITIR